MKKTVYKVYGISKWVGDISKKHNDIRTYVGEEDTLEDAEFLAAMFIMSIGANGGNWLNTTEIVEENI